MVLDSYSHTLNVQTESVMVFLTTTLHRLKLQDLFSIQIVDPQRTVIGLVHWESMILTEVLN